MILHEDIEETVHFALFTLFADDHVGASRLKKAAELERWVSTISRMIQQKNLKSKVKSSELQSFDISCAWLHDHEDPAEDKVTGIQIAVWKQFLPQ